MRTSTGSHHHDAEQLLAAGVQAPEVEAALVRAGLSRDDAVRVVNEVLGARVANASRVSAGRSINWLMIVLGIILAALGFFVAWTMLSERAADLLAAHLGPTKIKLLALPGGVLAFIGLNIVRTQLLAAWRSDS